MNKFLLSLNSFWKWRFLSVFDCIHIDIKPKSRNDNEVKSNETSIDRRIVKVDLDDESCTMTTDSRNSQDRLRVSQTLGETRAPKTFLK